MKRNNEFDQAVLFLQDAIREELSKLPDDMKNRITEIRIRATKPVVLMSPDGMMFLKGGGRVTYMYSEGLPSIAFSQIQESFHRLCKYSVYSEQKNITNGFITVQGGHRVALCGTAVTENGKIVNIRDITSLNIRIARQFIGCADGLVRHVFENGPENIILAGAPSTGKTTMLRDLARQLSNGIFGGAYKVCVIDERGEIASVTGGISQYDLGVNCDVLSSYPKSDGILTAVRTLSPEMIICDEIGTIEEVESIKSGLNSGVKFAVSIHASSYEELVQKIQVKALIGTCGFKKVILLKSGCTPCTIEAIYTDGELKDETYSADLTMDGVHALGTVCAFQNEKESQKFGNVREIN